MAEVADQTGNPPAAVAARPAETLPAELAIIVPTFNEAHNVPLLVEAVAAALPGVRWEIVFVDDNSPDGTAERARQFARTDPRVRILHRYGRRGLASACIEGILATSAPYAAVMDGDLQHDETILPAMLDRLRSGAYDLAVGSRYVEGGGMGEWNQRRIAMSRFATSLANKMTRTAIGDPMSGFFMVTREAFMASLPNLSSIGFKILLDIAASAPAPLRVAEVPFTFRTRQHGESKLDGLVLWEYLQLLIDKAIGHVVPIRMVSFALVGSVGVVVHLLTLPIALFALQALLGTVPPTESFEMAQSIATLVATTSNFFLNNMLTYRDQRLKGRRLFWGWVTFNLVCGVGLFANVGVARWLFQRHSYMVTSAIAGILVTTVWNYSMSSIFTWRRRG